MLDNQDSSPELIETRYRTGAMQETLNIELGLAGDISLSGQAQVSASAESVAGGSSGTAASGATGGVGGTGGNGTGGGQCFIGSTLVMMGDLTTRTFDDLYADRARYIGRFALTFDDKNRIHERQITDVFRSVKTEILEVKFTGEVQLMRMVKEHRFWTARGEFTAMHDLENGAEVYCLRGETMQPAIIKSKTLIKMPDGIEVYNLTVDEYHAYFAAASGTGAFKAVSNNKRAPVGEDFEQ